MQTYAKKNTHQSLESFSADRQTTPFSDLLRLSVRPTIHSP